MTDAFTVNCPSCHQTVPAGPRCSACGDPLPIAEPAALAHVQAEGEALPEEPPPKLEPEAAGPAVQAAAEAAARTQAQGPAAGAQQTAADPPPRRDPPPGAGGAGQSSWWTQGGILGSPETRRAYDRALRLGVGRAFDVKGRMGRGDFWRFVLMAVLAWVLVGLLVRPGPYASPEDVLGLVGLISLVFWVPLATAGVRRMHDTGKPGYWVWIVLGVSLFTVGLPLLALGWFLAQPGEPGPNAYGPPPAGPA